MTLKEAHLGGHIISASRRTDIPAFHTEWLVRRLREGYAYARNPYSMKTTRVSLRPADIHSIVFWSKNFNPLLKRIEEVERVTENLFFHFTVTASQGVLEEGTPERGRAVEDMLWLSGRYSPD